MQNSPTPFFAPVIQAPIGLRVPTAEHIRIPGLSGGINIDLHTRNPTGLLVYVQPYVDMAVGDEIDLRWGNPAVAIGTYPVTDKDAPVIMRIPWDKVSEGINIGEYDVRYLGGPPETAPQRQFLVKFTRPGGADPQPGVPGHQGLFEPILPDDIIDNGVGEEQAKAGVPLRVRPYPNMSEDDSIEVRWGARELFKRAPLAADEVGQDVVITIPEETILLGGDGPAIPVCYRVIDLVGNYSLDADDHHWSPNVYVDVYAGDSKLLEPYVKQAIDGVIDLDKLYSSDVTVVVDTERAPPWEVDDSIEVTWRGVTVDNVPITFVPPRQQINRLPRPYEFTIPYPQVSALYSSRAVVSYELIKEKTCERYGSLRASVQIKGDPLWLEPPVLLDAVDDVVAADLAVARVQIPVYSEMAEGDQLTLHWRGTGLYGEPVDYEYSRPVTFDELWKPIIRLVAGEYLAPLDGGRLQISYTVLKGEGLRLSDPVPYKVGAFSGILPGPQVLQAQGDLLNPDLLPPEGAKLMIPQANIIELGDTLTFSWRGSVSGLFEDSVPITALYGPLYFDIDRDQYVAANLLGTVDVSYRVNRGTALVGNSAVLHLRILSSLLEPSVKEANGNFLDPVAAQDTLTVVVPRHLSLQPSDQLTVTWAGAPGSPPQGSFTSTPRPLSQGLEVAVPNSVVAYSLGQDVTVTYTISRSTTTLTSEPFVLTVQAMPSTALNQLIIEEAANSGAGPQFDVTQVTTATVRVGTWPLIDPGQFVWLHVQGTNADGTAFSQHPWAGGTASTDAPWITRGYQTTPLQPVEALSYLKDGSDLTLTFKAALNKQDDETQAVTFAPRTYTVKAPADARPAITEVRDANGPVANGGATLLTQLNLTGIASAYQRVQLLDGTTVLGQAVADGGGTWHYTVTGLSLGAHEFTAKALYGTGGQSAGWSVLVGEIVTPLITEAQDSAGGEIANGGTTVATTVRLRGTASIGQRVKLFDGTTALGEAPVDAQGVWTYSAAGLSLTAHSFTAQALYDPDRVSPPWTITVVANVTPTITSAKEPSGTAISNGGTTTASTVTLGGAASLRQRVQILDGTAVLGEAQADGTGAWSFATTGLATSGHTFTAKALYGTGATSNQWVITVVAAITPTITSVRDAQAEIPNNGHTVATSVTLTGGASANQSVQVHDNSALKGTPPVNAQGIWTLPVSGLAIGGHSFRATAVYNPALVSNTRSFTVGSTFNWDTSSVVLSGAIYVVDGRGPSAAPPGTSVQRSASGGQTPYSYSSSNTGVATITSSGLIRAVANGTATMTARDARGETKTLTVQVTGVIKLHYQGSTNGMFPYYRPSRAQMNALWNQCAGYGGVSALGIPSGFYWINEVCGLSSYSIIHLGTGAVGCNWGEGAVSKYNYSLVLA